MSYIDRLDEEELPRNAAAIRTALLMGAEFFVDVGGMWQVKGIDLRSKNKTMPAWLYIGSHGICIDKDARPVKCSEIHHEDIP